MSFLTLTKMLLTLSLAILMNVFIYGHNAQIDERFLIGINEGIEEELTLTLYLA